MGVLWARVNHAKPRKGWGAEVPPLLHPLGVSERAAEGVIFSRLPRASRRVHSLALLVYPAHRLAGEELTVQAWLLTLLASRPTQHSLKKPRTSNTGLGPSQLVQEREPRLAPAE
jgi:hypothetical protein